MSKTTFFLLPMVFVLLLLFSGCEKEPVTEGNLTVSIDGLEDLGGDYVYEGWLMVAGSPVSTGTFTVDADGKMSQNTFIVGIDNLNGGTAFILSIEPSNDADPAPSNTKILAGDFSGNSGNLSVGHTAAIGDDFSTAIGSFVLNTPTTSALNDELGGVWFMDPTTGPGASLGLPTLPAGWIYEGWAVIDNVPVTTGTFTRTTAADDAAPYSGPFSSPPFPGEDFIVNAPSGVTFPPILRGATIVVSVEPVPDNSAAPFLLKPLVAVADANLNSGSSFPMDKNWENTNPTGTFSR